MDKTNMTIHELIKPDDMLTITEMYPAPETIEIEDEVVDDESQPTVGDTLPRSLTTTTFDEGLKRGNN